MRRSYAVFAIAVITLCCLAFPPQATAAEKPPAEPPQKIQKEYRYTDTQAPPTIKKTFNDKSGNTYELISSDAPVIDPAFTPPSQHYNHQITKEIPLEGINALGTYFPATVPIQDGYYVGAISLAADGYAVTNVYESLTGQVDRSYVIQNLPDNDASRLPAQMAFEVSSDASVGATTTATLNLLDVQYEVAGTNALGLPNNYTAYLVFRGQESWLAPHHYVVTAFYAGTIASNQAQYLITSHYQLVPEPVAEPYPSITLPAAYPALAPIPAGEASNPYIAYVATAVIVVFALALLLVWLIFFRRNIKLVRITAENTQVLLRKHLLLKDGQATLEVPDAIELFDHAHYLVQLKASLANKTGVLVIAWRNQVLAKEALRETIQIDMDSLVTNAVVQAIEKGVVKIPGMQTTGIQAIGD